MHILKETNNCIDKHKAGLTKPSREAMKETRATMDKDLSNDEDRQELKVVTKMIIKL